MPRKGLASCSVMPTLAVTVAMLVTAACGGSSSPPGSPNPGPSGEQISGNERLGWNQAAADSGELATFSFAAYIDDVNRVELTEVNCSGSAAPFGCSSRMPRMSAGSHTLALVSFVLDGSTPIESPRSAALRLVVSGATAPGEPNTSRAPVEFTTADGIRMRLEPVSDAFDRATSLTVANDGRVFVAERAGTIRILDAASLVPPAAFTMPDPAIVLSDVMPIGDDEGGLMGLALDPAFDRTHFVYALYTTGAEPGAARFRLARFREAGGQLGERAVLLDNIEAAPARPAAAIAIGPDGKLYAAFDNGGASATSSRPGSYNGKILRVNLDGTTPADQPGNTPVYASDLQAPRGLEWQPRTGALWLAETGNQPEELRALLAESVRSPRADTRARIPLPAGIGVSSLAFYRNDAVPALTNNLLIASNEGASLLRIRFDSRTSTRIMATERLLEDSGLRLQAIATGQDGAVYLATDRELLRLSPQSISR